MSGQSDSVAAGTITVMGSGTTLDASGTLSLTGTTVDFAWTRAAGLEVSAAALLAAGASIGGAVSIADTGLLDFAGTLAAMATLPGQPAVALSSGGALWGSGVLLAGISGSISGPGTLYAANTLTVAGGLTGGTQVEIGAGAVLELPDAVDASVTLDFAPGAGASPIAGGYADRLAQEGGVIVIADPQAFSGTIADFAPGDRLILPGLTGATLAQVAAQSFVVSGLGAHGLEHVTLQAALPRGAELQTGTDLAGDAEISLLPPAPALFLRSGSVSATEIPASGGVGQPLQGLQLLVPGWTSQPLTLTLSAGHGMLTDGGAPVSQLVLTASSPAALDQMLAGIVYTADLAAGSDSLVASSDTGPLAGLDSAVPIAIVPQGTLSGFAVAPSAGQTVLFAGADAIQTLAAAPGEIHVSGVVDFADALDVPGIGGTALVIDGGGVAVFDAAARVTLGGDVRVGDAAGPGVLGIAAPVFAIGSAGAAADLILGGDPAGAGSAVEISGTVAIAGALGIGISAAAHLDLSGSLVASTTTIGTAGTLVADGAAGSLGGLVDSGTVTLTDSAQVSATALALTGAMTLAAGATLSGLTGAVISGSGTLLVGPGALMSTSGLNQLAGAITVAGSLQTGNLLEDASLNLAGGALAGQAQVNGGATLSGFGEWSGTQLALAGALMAKGGALTLAGEVSMRNGGSIEIAGAATLNLLQGASGGGIGFAGPDAVLRVNDAAALSSPIHGMVASDVIDLVGVAPGLVDYANGTLSIADASGLGPGAFALATAAGQPAVTIVSDGGSGALVTLGGEMACFARGTRLLTPNGYVPVEAFKPRDPVITRGGARRAVRWIGRREVETAGPRSREFRPVVVLPDALGPGQPRRAVRLSPSHAVFVDGVLIPAMHLVNGATIIREPGRGRVTYFHLELDRHEVLMADGLAVESYVDTGNRGQFLHELGVRGHADRRCAPLVVRGPALARIRRRLHERVLAAGFSLAETARFHALADAARLLPDLRAENGRQIARFRLPRGAGRLLLQAQSAVPAETDPDSDDRRELAICLRQRPRQRFALGRGWYPRGQGDGGVWMGAEAEILLPPSSREVRLELVAVARSWRRPVDFAAAEL